MATARRHRLRIKRPFGRTDTARDASHWLARLSPAYHFCRTFKNSFLAFHRTDITQGSASERAKVTCWRNARSL